MRLAITGTTGFLGRHLVEVALRAGHEVAALLGPPPHGSALTEAAAPAGPEAPSPARPGPGGPRPARPEPAEGRAPAYPARPEPAEGRAGLTVIPGTLADLDALRRLVAGADAVLHLAALGVQSRDRDWERMTAVNVQQPLALAEEAKAAGAGVLVAVGTVLEYRGHGRLPGEPAPPTALCDEEASTEAPDPYGAAKAAGGLLLRARARDLGLPCWYLRLASMYGPGDDPQKLLPGALAAAAARRPFEMTAGEQVREWLHVDDAVAALLAAAAAPPPSGCEVVNAGTGEGVALRDLARRCFELAGADPALVRAGARPYRKGEVHRLVTTTARARRLLPAWAPRVPLDAGLAALLPPAGT